MNNLKDYICVSIFNDIAIKVGTNVWNTIFEEVYDVVHDIVNKEVYAKFFYKVKDNFR